MQIPSFKKGDKLWAADLQSLADAVRANRVLPGVGIRITGSASGTTVAANVPRASRGGSTQTLHQVDFEDLIPDPFKIMQEVMDEILNRFYSALPTAETIATVIANQMLNMDDYMPTAEAVGNIIASRIESYLIGGSVPALSFENLFDRFANSAPSATQIADALMPYFQPALDVMEGIDALVQEKYEQYANVGTLITAHFAGANAAEGEAKPGPPSPGDYLYCEEGGILYTMFPVGFESGIPTANLVWRIHFQIGTGDNQVWWCALTTFPAPDVGAICRLLGRIGKDLIEKSVALIAGPVAGLTRTFARLLKKALGKLDEIPDAIGKALKKALDRLWDAINNVPALIANAVGLIWDEINGNIWPSLTYALDGIALLWEEINNGLYPAIAANEEAIAAMQEIITSLVADIALLKNPLNSITYVGHDGQLYTVPSLALGTCIGVTKQMDIDWIGIDGNGHAMKVLMWDGTYMPEAINSEEITVIHEDGTTSTIHTVGVVIPGNPAFTPKDIGLCEDGTPTTERFLISTT